MPRGKDSDWMAAREMVIGKFINQIGFRIDHSTVQQVKNTVESVKSGIKTVQGVSDEVKKASMTTLTKSRKRLKRHGAKRKSFLSLSRAKRAHKMLKVR